MFEIHFFTYHSCHTIMKCTENQAIKALKDYRNCGLGFLWQSTKLIGEYAIVKQL